MAEAESQELCPLCVEPLDATDRAIRYCACGYRMCLWCWHQIMETAAKENQTGKCPNCRSPYEKGKVSMSEVEPDEFVEEKRKKKQPERRRGANGRSRKHLQDVRILQRNLVYAVGLSLGICNEETLRCKEYFGQFGKIKKISVNRSSPYSTGQSRNGPTGAAYVTYVSEEDASKCIEAIDRAVWDGRYVRACYGTTKYCAAFLKGVTCNNPDCLYMHEIVDEDTFTKEDMLSGFANGKPPFYHLIYFDRSKGPVPGSLANKPPRGPGGSSNNGASRHNGLNQDVGTNQLIKGLVSPGRAHLSSYDSSEGLDWPELNRHPTSLDSTTIAGKQKEGNEKSDDSNRPCPTHKSMDSSWTCNRGTAQPRSPSQSQGNSSQLCQDTHPKKTLAILSSPVRVKMVTRPPPIVKASGSLSARLSGDGPVSGTRADNNLSDSEEHDDVKAKAYHDQREKVASAAEPSGDINSTAQNTWTGRGNSESSVSVVSEDQGSHFSECSATSQSSDEKTKGHVTKPKMDSNQSTKGLESFKPDRLSPPAAGAAEAMADCNPDANQTTSNKQNWKKHGSISRESRYVSDTCSRGFHAPSRDSDVAHTRQEMNYAETKVDKSVDVKEGGGVVVELRNSLQPLGFTKSKAATAEGCIRPRAAKRGPPPGFENAIARGNVGQAEASIQKERNDVESYNETEMRHSLHLQQPTLLDEASQTAQARDLAPNAVVRNLVDTKVEEAKNCKEIPESAGASLLGTEMVLSQAPQQADTELSMQQLPPLLMGLQAQISSGSVLVHSQPPSVAITQQASGPPVMFHGNQHLLGNIVGQGSCDPVAIQCQQLPPSSIRRQATGGPVFHSQQVPTGNVAGQGTVGSLHQQVHSGTFGGHVSNGSVVFNVEQFPLASVAGQGMLPKINDQVVQSVPIQTPDLQLQGIQHMRNSLGSLEGQGYPGQPQIDPMELIKLQSLGREMPSTLGHAPPMDVPDNCVSSHSFNGNPNFGKAGANNPFYMGFPPNGQSFSEQGVHHGGRVHPLEAQAAQKNSFLDLLLQLQDGPTARQRTVNTNACTSQPAHNLIHGPLTDPAIISAKKVSPKSPSPQVAGMVLPPELNDGVFQQQNIHQGLQHKPLLMHEALQQRGVHEQPIATVNGLHRPGGVPGQLPNGQFSRGSGTVTQPGELNNTFPGLADKYLLGWGSTSMNSTQVPMGLLTSHAGNNAPHDLVYGPGMMGGNPDILCLRHGGMPPFPAEADPLNAKLLHPQMGSGSPVGVTGHAADVQKGMAV